MGWSSKEKRQEYARKYYATHPQKVKEWREKGNQKNKEARKASSKRYYDSHKVEQSARKMRYYYTHREKIRQSNSRYLLSIKQTVLAHYGSGKCVCAKCGFEDIRALSLDHVNGGGTKHRERIPHIYKWLIDNDYPEGYQTLCMNCQWIKRYESKELYKELSGGVDPNVISTIQGVLKLE